MSLSKRLLEIQMKVGVDQHSGSTGSHGETILYWSDLEEKQAESLHAELVKEFGEDAVGYDADKEGYLKVVLTLLLPRALRRSKEDE